MSVTESEQRRELQTSLGWRPRTSRERPPDGTLGHLDSVYALAYLSSGDGDDAEQFVIDAFLALCGESTGKFVCDSCAWRVLADHVRLASCERGISPSDGRAPFRDGALSQDQGEAIALVLGGRESLEAADLLGVSLLQFERHLSSGLEMLHEVMGTIPASCVCLLADAPTVG
jgi:hypothetical protein